MVTQPTPAKSPVSAKIKAILAFVALVVANALVNYTQSGNLLPLNDAGVVDWDSFWANVGTIAGGTGLVYAIPAKGYVPPA